MVDEIIIRFSVKSDGTPQIEQLNKTLDKTTKAGSGLSKGLDTTNKSFKAFAPGVESARGKLTSFISTNAALIGIVVGVGLALNKAMNQVVEYGDQVQKLKTITGQSAEDTSRQIQLADDMRVSYEKLTVALQFASKNGTDTSINGLAKLADQYKSLQPGIERTTFLTDTFGKSGVDMAKILDLDSAKLKEMAANTNIGKILTDEDMRNIKEYNHALDSMKDKFESTSNTAGKKLLPVTTFAIDTVSLYSRALQLGVEEHMNFVDAMTQAASEINSEKAAFMAAGEAADGATESIEDNTAATEAAEEAANALSESLTGLLSSMFAIQDENEQLYKDMEDVAKTEKDLEQQRAEALGDLLKSKDKQSQKEIDLREKIDETTDADKRRKLIQDGLRDATEANNDATAEYLKKIQEIDEKTIEAAAKRKELAEQDTENSKKRVYDLAQQRLAADGLIDAGEYEYLQDLAVAKGLVTQAAADQAIAESQEADALIANFNKTNPVMQTTLDTMQNIAALHGTVVDYQVNFRVAEDGSLVSDQFYGSGGYSPYALPAGAGGSSNKKRDSGGSGIAGMAYEIGTGAQPETFVPDTNGQFYPKGKGLGNTTIINITNPKREVAENSIRKALKSLSYLGVAS